ncbi:hypothetical protein H257_15259 [Aphanomyces astaci]|uniref:Uncharacterized protein n=1 Tax=Aphanomyces astaci TaxID=112090 RepID=W4FQ05_APHAT|nr:hypothetical protein H257_15259 [Aphanomyces astaci]ETV68914.1 hypothetical protein H257_15259 [Aphanomyces astaci]|eukprot:XP_009841591.1 hypothetical protein H257_15259 [Aphanomyces astaci]
MKNIFRSFEAQRPSLPSTPLPSTRPQQYQPSLHLSKADISAMFLLDVQQPDHHRRHSLVHDERRRRHSLHPPRPASNLRSNKEKLPYEMYGDNLVDDVHMSKKPQHHTTSLANRPKVVLFDATIFTDSESRTDQSSMRHSMPSQFCY